MLTSMQEKIAIQDVRGLIDLWPTRRELADEVFTTVDRVHKWAQSGAIPARFHARFLRAADLRGFDVTAEVLVRLHDVPGQAA